MKASDELEPCHIRSSSSVCNVCDAMIRAHRRTQISTSLSAVGVTYMGNDVGRSCEEQNLLACRMRYKSCCIVC